MHAASDGLTCVESGKAGKLTDWNGDIGAIDTTYHVKDGDVLPGDSGSAGRRSRRLRQRRRFDVAGSGGHGGKGGGGDGDPSQDAGDSGPMISPTPAQPTTVCSSTNRPTSISRTPRSAGSRRSRSR